MCIFLLLCLLFSHDCRKRKNFNLWSVWYPAVLENIFCMAKAVSLACHLDIPREQGWRAVETWDSLEAACWTGHWAVTEHNDLFGSLHPPLVGFAALAHISAAFPRHAAAWPWSLRHCCELVLSLFWFVLLLLLLSNSAGKEHDEMFSVFLETGILFCA